LEISPQFGDFRKNPHIREYRKKLCFVATQALSGNPIWSSFFIFSGLMDDGFVPGTVDGLLVGLKAEEHQRATDL
jgi:hypothetical protein